MLNSICISQNASAPSVGLYQLEALWHRMRLNYKQKQRFSIACSSQLREEHEYKFPVSVNIWWIQKGIWRRTGPKIDESSRPAVTGKLIESHAIFNICFLCLLENHVLAWCMMQSFKKPLLVCDLIHFLCNSCSQYEMKCSGVYIECISIVMHTLFAYGF